LSNHQPELTKQLSENIPNEEHEQEMEALRVEQARVRAIAEQYDGLTNSIDEIRKTISSRNR
jgi:hypothetical protein